MPLGTVSIVTGILSLRTDGKVMGIVGIALGAIVIFLHILALLFNLALPGNNGFGPGPGGGFGNPQPAPQQPFKFK